MKIQQTYLKNYASQVYPNYRHKFIDINASVYKGIPKQLEDILNVAKKGDVLAVYHIDRLSRNIPKMMGILDSLSEKGVLIFSLKNGGNGLYYHQNRYEFLDAIWTAQKESMRISDRTKKSFEWRKKRGDDFVTTYGFKYERQPITIQIGDTKTNTYKLKSVKNNEELEIVKRINKMYNYGESHKTIAKILNMEGIKNRNRQWNEQMVKRICSKLNYLIKL
jgi:DNA invertase Pin-like site-specific DNA recombinase